MFSGFEIAEDESFEKHLNRYDVIFLNMQDFLSRSRDINGLIDRISRLVIRDLKSLYPDVDFFDDTNVVDSIQDVYAAEGYPFVVIIDEWDCIFREYKNDKASQEIYLDFLWDFIKDKEYIHLTYMTGILPVKKYGTHSALNMFDEFSMIDPGPLAEYVGFTEQEVSELCDRYGMDLVFVPRKRFADRPALVVELKWNDTAEGVVEQIKNREYCRSFEEYSGSTLLVGVSYDRQTKEHRCVIEKAVKPQ